MEMDIEQVNNQPNKGGGRPKKDDKYKLERINLEKLNAILSITEDKKAFLSDIDNDTEKTKSDTSFRRRCEIIFQRVIMVIFCDGYSHEKIFIIG